MTFNDFEPLITAISRHKQIIYTRTYILEAQSGFVVSLKAGRDPVGLCSLFLVAQRCFCWLYKLTQQLAPRCGKNKKRQVNKNCQN